MYDKFYCRNGFLIPENIPIDTKISFLSIIVKKLYLIKYYGGHLGSHLEFLKLPKVDFLATKLKIIFRPYITQISNKTLGYSTFPGSYIWSIGLATRLNGSGKAKMR